MQIYSVHFISFSIRLNKNKIYNIFTDIYSDTNMIINVSIFLWYNYISNYPQINVYYKLF